MGSTQASASAQALLVEDAKTDERSFVKVRTTLPILPLPKNAHRPAVTTARLVIRPIREEDLHEYHVLRTQPAVMINTRKGVIDRDIGQTKERLGAFLPPNDLKSYWFAICLKEEPDVLIGGGGCHIFTTATVSF
jgi:RimJ/RimL family protein N-acetyltransferase